MADRLSWLVLAYRVPAEPTRLRAAVWRRLKGAGAVYLAHSVAALPASTAAERLLCQLRSDIGEMGGSAQLLRAEAVAGETEVIRLFNAKRDREYARITAGCDDLFTYIESPRVAGRWTPAEWEHGGKRLAELTRRHERIRTTDAFGASGAESAAAALIRCREALDGFAERVNPGGAEPAT